MNLTISRSVISLSKGISVVNQYTDFVPFSLNDQLSFELANQKYISATAVCRKKGAILLFFVAETCELQTIDNR